MKLLDKTTIDLLPAIYSQEEVADPVCRVKFFTPWTSWTWYAYEGDVQETGDYLMFGWVHGTDPEYGYFSIAELESVKGPFGMTIERDRHFEPTPFLIVRAASLEGRPI